MTAATRGAPGRTPFTGIPFTGPERTLSVRSSAIPMVLDVPALEPVRLSGTEGINGLFAYELLLKTPDGLNLDASGAADFDLDAFIGRELQCSVQLDGSGPLGLGAGTREINTLVTDACLWGEEGRHLQYKLTLRPWLHLATLSTDCRIFQNQSAVQILDALLSDYPFPVDKRLLDTYPTRDYQTQYNESDFAFFERLTQEWGISYFFEHSEGTHRLVLVDAMGAFKTHPSAAYRSIDYHAPGWKTDAEYVSSFVPANQLTSGRYSTRDHDYTRPRADLSVSRADPRPTGQAAGEVYQWHAGGPGAAGSHYAQPRAGSASGSASGTDASNDPQAEGRQLALLRMQALRTHGARATASGNLRAMVPGCTFALNGHPRQSVNTDWLVLDTRLLIEDVAPDSQIREAATGRTQRWKVEVDFTAHPVTEPLRPEATRAKPAIGGPHSALVVGPEGENLWTDDLGRIKVQFPWDRVGQKNQHSTCWLRVSSPWAGNQLGGMHLPRIGQEVMVDFIAGDADLPICTGRVHNQMNLPPWELPGQAALSGFRSRELTRDGGNSAAGRSNHLILDDTDSQIQVQLKSDHQSSSLSLGHITRIEDNAGRKDPRGEGFELRTDGHGVVRAAMGVLVTTEGRGNAAGAVKDMDETVARLKAAQDQHEQLAEAAQTHKAQDKGDDQDIVQRELKEQNKSVEGNSRSKDSTTFPELNAPHMVLSSPAGIEATTPASIHLHTGEHVAITSQGHTSLSIAKRWLASAADGIRVFTHKKGIKLIASEAPIEIQAHKSEVVLIAHKDVRMVSVNDEIHITAKKKVVVIGGGSYSEWSATGITHGTAGTWMEHASLHAQVGPETQKQSIFPLPVSSLLGLIHSNFSAQFVIHSEAGKPIKNIRYTLIDESGSKSDGTTDILGKTRRIYTAEPAAIYLTQAEPHNIDVDTPQRTDRNHDIEFY